VSKDFEGGINPDNWPCGLVVIDEAGQIHHINATLKRWLSVEGDLPSLRFIDILSRASRIYFETHLRPLLLINGEFSEVSIDLERRDGTRVSVFINGSATLADGQMVEAHFSMFQNEQRHAFERELVAKRRENDEFKSLVRSSPHAIVSVDASSIIQAWNPAAEQLFGFSETEAIGQRFDRLLVPPQDLTAVADDLKSIAAGNTIRSETERLHKDGRRIHVERSVATIRNDMQEFSGFVATYSDISERKASEARIGTLIEEIHHRSKNLLSIVQVIARQTGHRYEGDEFISVFSKRLASLTLNQEILIRNQSTSVDLEALARGQFEHLFDPSDPRVTISGPEVQLNEAVSQAVGMAIFELVTNAAKYGALSQEEGTVILSWTITEGPASRLEISWIESGGPLVVEPTRKGFGYQVTGPILDNITSGQTCRDYASTGFRWSFSAPYHQPSR